jgi:hypothetical protein
MQNSSTKQVVSRRSTVLRLPLQLVFPVEQQVKGLNRTLHDPILFAYET